MSYKLYIMRGLPGSGKTTKAKQLAGERGAIISADDFFMVKGEYVFDPSRIGEAHGYCMRQAIAHLHREQTTLVVDNTNIANIEIAPYVLLAQAYKWQHEIVTFHTNNVYLMSVCANRNTHGVPLDRVIAMFERLLLELPQTPPWWNQKIIEPTVDP